MEDRGETGDGRRFSPSAARNASAIADVFSENMPVRGRVLEIASGTGEHGFHMTARFRELFWTYSDIDPEGLASQRAWRAAADHDRLSGPIELDMTEPGWVDVPELAGTDAIFCANMIHIAPFAAAEGLIAGAGRLLGSGARLMLYGPFRRKGEMATSNWQFDASLRRRNPGWGVRDLDGEIVPLAAKAGFELHDTVAMPANNLCVLFVKA